MPTIFQQLEDFATKVKARLELYKRLDEGHDFSWPNYVYAGCAFRRAHLDIVDARETKKLYMMHLCIFPNTNSPAPIYGFDIIAGDNKVTGAFHDFSPIGEHPLNAWFAEQVAPYEWSKKRDLPEWARNIFSTNMVAAGNISDEAELAKVLDLAMRNLSHYLAYIHGHKSEKDYTMQQNFYCQNQKKNPHTPRVMASLGLDPDEVHKFVEECLFPEIKPPEQNAFTRYLSAMGEAK
jgi:hypothetical protein